MRRLPQRRNTTATPRGVYLTCVLALATAALGASCDHVRFVNRAPVGAQPCDLELAAVGPDVGMASWTLEKGALIIGDHVAAWPTFDPTFTWEQWLALTPHRIVGTIAAIGEQYRSDPLELDSITVNDGRRPHATPAGSNVARDVVISSQRPDNTVECRIASLAGGVSADGTAGRFPVGLPRQLHTGDRVLLVGYDASHLAAMFVVDSLGYIEPATTADFGVDAPRHLVALADLIT